MQSELKSIKTASRQIKKPRLKAKKKASDAASKAFNTSFKIHPRISLLLRPSTALVITRPASIVSIKTGAARPVVKLRAGV